MKGSDQIDNPMTPENIEYIRRVLQMNPDQHMSNGQYHIIYKVYIHLINPNRHNEPLRLIILGGPGTGKTYSLSQVERITHIPIIYTAIGGAAASNLPGGKTVCNVMNFNPKIRTKSPSSKTALPTMNSNNDALKLLFLQQQFQQKHGLLCLDELSMITALYFIHTSNRLREVPLKVEYNQEPFGNHDVIFMGDWNQIPAIGENIPKWIFRVLIQPSEIKSPQDDLMVEATRIFKTFKRMKLTEQQRARNDN